MAITFVNVGTSDASIGAITPGAPSGVVVGDVLVYVIETNDNITVSGFTECVSSPQNEPVDGTQLTVLWRRATGTDPLVSSDSGNHQVGQVAAFRGCITSGTPFEATAGSTSTSASNPGSIPGVTSLTDGAMLIAVAGTGADITGTARYSAWTNAALVSITELFDVANLVADGGGFGAAYGIKTTAGAIGATTFTESSPVTRTYWAGALIPAGVGKNPRFENYKFVTVGNGMSSTNKII